MDVRLALTGFGSVGQGVATVLGERAGVYRKRYGLDLKLTGVADRGGAIANRNGLDPEALLTAKGSGSVCEVDGGTPGLRGEDFLDRAEAQVLLEAASTNFSDAEPGWSYARGAIRRGMDVVFASKGALVLHFREIMNEARDAGCLVRFAATVGAPLPVLELPDRMLVGLDITSFEGILNATSNYILSAMGDGASYQEAVRQAQAIGIAETDPTLDVDGWDAAAKAVIVSNALLGADLKLPDVPRQGIREISRADLDQARLKGQAIKLIASGRRGPEGVAARVTVERRPLADALGRLRSDQMGVVLFADQLGSVATTVQQTGGLATALTMLRDVVNLARERSWTKQIPG